MKVLLAGATGAIGRPLLSILLANGHEVHGTTRDHERAKAIEAAGAEPEIVDFLRSGAANELVAKVKPDVIVDQLTSLPRDLDPRDPNAFAANDKIRFEGSGALLRAAEDHEVGRYVAQSIAFLYEPGKGQVRSEDDPAWTDAPPPFGHAVEVVTLNERKLIESEKLSGAVLRFGALYGPGTWLETDGSSCRMIRERQYPLSGGGTGLNSLVHVSDAARAAAIAVERGDGVYNIVDDEPVSYGELIPYLAELLGAKKPRNFPAWLARKRAGKLLVEIATSQAGASNAKAKSELGWTPQLASWRDGLRDHRDSLLP
jgi:2-alkyl-3-oxoalkanoate reductase